MSKTGEELEEEESELIMTIKRGVLSTLRNEYDKAEQLYHLALRNAQTLRNELAVTYIYDLMANLAYETGQLPKAEKLFVTVMQRILEQEHALEDDIRLLHISSKIAHIAYLQDNFEKSLIGYNYVLDKIKERDYLNQSNYHELYGIVKNLIGQSYIALKKFPEAKASFLEAHTIFKKYKSEMTEDGIILLNNMSCSCAELQEYDLALKYLNEAIEIAKKINIEDLSPYQINLGMLYIKRKMLENALSSCSQGWKFAKKYDNKDALHAAEKCLEEINKLKSLL
jgi:tetratricopeptide repeat protein 19, mitochondrial